MSPDNQCCGSKLSFSRRPRHALPDGLVIRVDLPLGHGLVSDHGPPRGRRLPRVPRAQLTAPAVRSAGGADQYDVGTVAEELVDVDVIVRDHLEVLTPALLHRDPTDEDRSQGIDESVIDSHELGETGDVTLVDAVYELPNHLARGHVVRAFCLTKRA